MGVRESKLEPVPALALGTSDVTLKEMVAAYGTIASAGSYRAPQVITRIEDKDGRLLEEFKAAPPERALGLTAAQELRDALRGVVDKGTGAAIRTRYGITADVAGKTGTTQDNTDGWFILMHPQLVAGAWVGFNDARITLRSDYWGQGAHSALPMVGDVFRQALRAKLIDARERFVDEEESSWAGRTAGAVSALRNWVYDLFGRPTGEQAGPAGAPEPELPRAPAPPASTASAPLESERPEITDAPLVPLQEVAPRAPVLVEPPVWMTEPDGPQPEPGMVTTEPVHRGVVVPSPWESPPQ
jgi:penicillin-binding protein 1A